LKQQEELTNKNAQKIGGEKKIQQEVGAGLNHGQQIIS
jgi:hypothetical protein